MESLQTICVRLATEHIAQINTDEDCNVPEQYNEKIKNVVTYVRPRVGRLDRIEVPFIRTAFEDMTKVKKTLEEKTENGEVPDGILQKLSLDIYEKEFNDLTTEEQAIIKVLACYIIIS